MISLGDDSDNVRSDAAARRLYVGYDVPHRGSQRAEIRVYEAQ